MYTVFFYNFGYAAQERFPTVDAALEHARKACFQAGVLDAQGNVIASFCPLQGVRRITP